MDGPLADAFAAASRFLLDSVDLVGPSDWDRPGLGTWSVRELVAHANRGQTTVVEYLLRPRPPEGRDYFTQEAVAERGRAAVAALGADPPAAVRAAGREAVALVADRAADAEIGTPAGTMALADYLPSRVSELTIHTLDLLRALDLDRPVPPAALRVSLEFVAGRAAATGPEVLLALTGRGTLPPGFSVY
jgi:uncharacterized protein (TIGR03083 family)